MLFGLTSIDAPLEPVLYVDRGRGFNEEDAVRLDGRAGGVFSISVQEPRQITCVRLDPSSSPVRFGFWYGFAWSERERDELLAKASRDVAAVHQTITLDGTGVRRTSRLKPFKPVEFFNYVVGLAGRSQLPTQSTRPSGELFISLVVPTYNSKPRHLDDLLASVRRQPAGAAELILSDDGSSRPETLEWFDRHANEADVKIVRNPKNRGIAAATNQGIAVARGIWVGLVDHDDALSPFAIPLIVEAARDNPNCQFVYTDEVVADRNLKPVSFFFKPAYDEVLLSGVNYINHLSCYRRDRLNRIGMLRQGYEGSQDYDLLLRYLNGLSRDEIRHLPYPAYIWRRGETSFSTKFMDRATVAARRSLAEKYGRDSSPAILGPALTETLHRVRFDQRVRDWPRISIIIASRDAFSLISTVMSGLLHQTDYPEMEIIVVDNGSTDPRVLNLYRDLERGPLRFKYEIETKPFNFARQVNRGVALATGEYFLLLNNDIEMIEPNWLREMMSCFEYPNTGIVGARLLYPNRTIQHAGVVVGLGGLAGHPFGGKAERFPGPMARLHVRQSMTAVTGACMLVSRTCWETVGAFEEEKFAVAYNDIDFCLRAAENGFRAVWTPFATLIHAESASRGSDETRENRARFESEKQSLRARHHTDKFIDPSYNPWLSRQHSDARPIRLDRLPKAR